MGSKTIRQMSPSVALSAREALVLGSLYALLESGERNLRWIGHASISCGPRPLASRVRDTSSFTTNFGYAKRSNQLEVVHDGYLNYHWLLSPSELGRPMVMLEAGINAPCEVVGPDGSRRALIAIRSSPWKAGHESNPWHDEFDLDHGHVRYFGDHKPGTVGLPGATKGNRLLLERLGYTLERRTRSGCSPHPCSCSAARPSTGAVEPS